MAGYQSAPGTDSPNVQQMESGWWWTRTVCPSVGPSYCENVYSTVKYTDRLKTRGVGEYLTILFCYIKTHLVVCGAYVEVTSSKFIYFYLLWDGQSYVFKVTKSGTPAFIINQAFIFSFMWFDYIIFEVSKLDEDELFIAESIMPYHRHRYLPVYAFTYMYACIHVAYM